MARSGGSMARKVQVAIFDNDLRCNVGKYDVSDDGTKIRIKSGGEGHFMPTFNNDSFLEFPYRAFTSFWKTSYRRIYVVKKKADSCVNFKTGEVPIPNPEEQKEAISKTLLGKIGKPESDGLLWWQILLLIVTIATAAKVFGVIV